MNPAGTSLVAFLIAVSFAAGLNLYATVASLGLLARLGWIILPSDLRLLASAWVILPAIALFLVEVFANRIPFLGLALERWTPSPAAPFSGSLGFSGDRAPVAGTSVQCCRAKRFGSRGCAQLQNCYTTARRRGRGLRAYLCNKRIGRCACRCRGLRRGPTSLLHRYHRSKPLGSHLRVSTPRFPGVRA